MPILLSLDPIWTTSGFIERFGVGGLVLFAMLCLGLFFASLCAGPRR